MAPPGQRRGKKGPRPELQRPRLLKRKREEEDIETLSQRVADLDPKSSAPPENFVDVPLSQATQDGLAASHFKTLTTIQSRAIPLALQGADILGAAKTGSGKTLAFLIPVLENLYRKRWTDYDGVGALILSPTRELAIQIFEVLRKVGRNHMFSAGLVIGGKSLQEERERLGHMNILVATPGRMLQHMDQTSELDIGNLQMLVLDEADRIMDMGFSQTIDALIEHLPRERQTLMFSATQTKKVSDLARLSLKEPEFVSVHEAADSATPSTLQQNYVVTSLPDKLDTLWSFIRANVKKKILVFLSSGKQVRFVYESFRHLQPGIPLLHLHGRQKQTARLEITTKYSNSKYACLFSTDVAARGLDFPAVDWVVQVDCPEDADTYIHRVGRTARFEHEGRAILFVDPSEETGMLNALERKKVFLEKINVRQKKMQQTIRNQLQNMCFKDPELKYLGQKAFVSYVRSVHVQKDKETFNVKRLDLEGFAASLGLPGAPRVKFVKGEDAKARKNAPRQLLAALEGSDSESDDAENGEKQKKRKGDVRTKYDRMFERRNQGVLAEHYTKLIEDEDEDEDEDTEADDHATGGLRAVRNGTSDNNPNDEEEDDFLSVKRRFHVGDSALDQEVESESDSDNDSNNDNVSGTSSAEGSISHSHSHSHSKRDSKSDLDANPSASKEIKTLTLSTARDAHPLTIDSHRREKLLKSKKALLKYKGKGAHLTFDSDSDTPKDKKAYRDEETFTAGGRQAAEAEIKEFRQREAERAMRADEVDKEIARTKKREKKEKRKERERRQYLGMEDREGGDDYDEQAGVQLVPYDDDNNDDDDADADADADPRRQDDGVLPKAKRARKWFEDASSDDGGEDEDEAGGDIARTKSGKMISKRRKKNRAEDGHPQTLDELEALASGLLAGS
ncbi:ATP-dependent RNA helicase DBP4 [Cladophialophora carrionii]|uniref:ATP-dependent RNA helicase n=1 Tax=Cladophialophora carrionii TaxID=86049 RepID=A0A1C1C7F5_9EURO|nr:ATP-dependent RNA helicase DBP4 [Cladophialophora carrionii]